VGSDAQVRADGESGSNSLDLRAALRLILRQKWVILGVFSATLGATIFITLSLTKVYEAVATLEYDPNPARPLGSGVEDVATPAGNFLAGKEWYQTQNTIIGSRTIAARVVDRLSLHRDPDFMDVPAKLRGTWRGTTRDDATKELIKSLKVRQERETRVARIEVQNSSPERAALLANSIAQAYMDWMMEERLGSTVRAVEWLSGQLDDVSRRLDTSERALYDFRRTNNVLSVSLADQQNGIIQTINNFGNALTAATARRIEVEAKLAQLEAALRDDPTQVHATLVSESESIPLLRQRYHETVVERNALAVRFGDNHPEMRRVRDQLDTLLTAMRKEISGLVESLRGQLNEARDIERGLERVKQQTQNMGLDLNLHEIDYNRLERGRVNNEKLHTLLLQRTTEANLARLLQVSPVRIVDRAVAPDLPVRPRPMLNIAAGCLAGLLLGFGFAVLRTQMDRTVRVPDDVTAFGWPLLGLVPSILDGKGLAYGTRGHKRRREGSVTQTGRTSSFTRTRGRPSPSPAVPSAPIWPSCPLTSRCACSSSRVPAQRKASPR